MPRDVVPPIARTATALMFALLLVAAPVSGAVAPGHSTVAETHQAGGSNTDGTTSDLTLEQTTLGNIFHTGQTPTVRVSTDAESVSYRVSNHWGRIVDSGDTDVSDTTTVTFDLDRVGHYELHVQTPDGASEETSMAVLPDDDYPNDDRFFGISPGASHKAPAEEIFDLYDRTGIGTFRGSEPWRSAERERGEFNFSGQDRLHELGTERGMEAFYILWASNPIYHDEDEWYGLHTVPINETQKRGYQRYVREIVSHYDDTPYFEMWNEFEHGGFSKGPGANQAWKYAELLELTYPALKEANPDTKLVAGGVASGSTMNYDYWRDVFENDTAQYMDVMSVHPYRPVLSDLEADIEKLRDLRSEYTDRDIPIWITEIGGDNQQGAITVDYQARYVIESHVRSKAADVQRVYWYNYVDQSTNAKQFGLIRNPEAERGSYAPKPSLPTYAVMTRQLNHTDFVEKSHDPVNRYTLETQAGEHRHVLWSSERRDLTVETDDPVTVTDMMGRTTELEPTGGEVYVSVDSNPIYLTGNVEAISEGTPVSMQGGTGVSGDVVPVTLRSDSGTSATATIDGTTFSVSGGETTREHIDAAYAPGTATAVGTIEMSGQTVGRLTTDLDVRADPVTVSMAPRIDGQGHALSLTLQNLARERSYTPTAIEWSVGDTSGERTLDGNEIARGGNRTVRVPVDGVGRWSRENASVTVAFADRASITAAGVVGFNPIARVDATVDGDLTEYESLPSASFVDDGAVERPDADELDDAPGPDDPDSEPAAVWKGPADHGGTTAFGYDDEHLYVAVNVSDDVHSQEYEPGAMWKGDSVQLGISTGLPGSNRAYYSQTIGLTSEGPRFYRRNAISGPTNTVLDSTDVAIERDEAAGQTHYEIAIPWSALGPMGPGEEPISLSVLVNDNDGGERLGWIEWGQGIGMGKDPSKYQAMTFVDSGVDIATPAPATPSPEPTAESPTPSRTPDANTLTDSPDPTDATPGEDQMATPEPDDESTPTPASSPGFGVIALLAALLAVVLVRRRR